MAKTNDWEQFFDGHAPEYMNNCFTKNTQQEVDFVIEELQIPAGGRVLDIGCGTGRHSVELAKRGYRMTGVDISTGMLAGAQKAAEEAGVQVEWVHSNAADFKAGEAFDAAICLCEGAFCLLSADDDPIDRDLTILRNISDALKPGGRFMLTTINGLAKTRRLSQEDVESGMFDPVTMIETFTMEWDTPEGKKSVALKERGYTPPELTGVLRQAGFEVEHIWGGTAGNWGRRKIELDEMEIMAVARKA